MSGMKKFMEEGQDIDEAINGIMRKYPIDNSLDESQWYDMKYDIKHLIYKHKLQATQEAGLIYKK